MTDRSKHPIVHFVGSIPLPDSETVFRTLSKAVGPHLTRLPDGETGIRKSWIRFLQDVLSGNSAIEFATDVPPFKFVQWDGKVVREIPRLRVKPGATIDPATFDTGYADDGDRVVGRVRAIAEGRRHSGERQIPDLDPDADRADLQQHGAGRPAEAAGGADAAFPRRGRQDRQGAAERPHRDPVGRLPGGAGLGELLRPGPVDFRTETIDVLTRIGDGVPAGIELGYHLCYGSPADEHMVLPKDMGIMVEMTNAIVAGVKRPIQFIHMPVVKARTDDAYFAPLKNLKLGAGHRALSRPDPSQRRERRRGAARRRPAPCAGRRHRHRMRHGARRSGAAAGAARGARTRCGSSANDKKALRSLGGLVIVICHYGQG